MTSRRVAAEIVGAAGSTVTVDVDLALKGVQIRPPPDVPEVADLVAADVGSVRIISGGYTQAHFDALEAYCVNLRAADIFPIVCQPMQSGLGLAAWRERARAWAGTIGSAGVFELGNEHGPGFAYGGSQGDYAGYFAAIEDAAPIIESEGGTPIMGAAMDVHEVARLNAAQTRWGAWGADGWPTPAGVAIHPYGQSNPWTRNGALSMVVTRLERARARIPQRISLFVTETGWGVAGNVESTLVLLGGAGTLADREAEQAVIVRELYRRLWLRCGKDDLNLASIGYFFWRDRANPSSWWHYAGLHDAQGVARPALAAFAAEPACKPRL